MELDKSLVSGSMGLLVMKLLEEKDMEIAGRKGHVRLSDD